MLVFMFPGQSSADPQMIVRASALHEATAAIVEGAIRVLGPEGERYFDPAGISIQCNRDVQISVFLATQMHLAALAAEGIAGAASAGLSLGEFSHLVHIGALAFENALQLVSIRGALYDRAPRGSMVTIVGPGQEEVELAVRSLQSAGTVVVSNYNTPTQHVISGESLVVERVAERLEQDGAQTFHIESRVAMHSPLLDQTAAEFRPHLEAIGWEAPVSAYLPNVTGNFIESPGGTDYVDNLTAHVNRPVQWQRSIEQLAGRHQGATFVEVGPGRVLHNLLSRRWLDVKRMATDQTHGRDMQWRQTVETLHAGS